MEVVNSIYQVFSTNGIPLNYIQRQLDEVFVENITHGNHVVVHGSSKQGKTSLRKYHLEPAGYIAINCINTWTLEDIFKSILKAVGFIQETEVKSQKTGKVGGGLSIWKFKFDSSAEKQMVRTGKSLEINTQDPNDVVSALKENGFDNKVISIDDFHYLVDDVQKSFSTAVKVFHDNSDIKFLITAVWSGDRISVMNGDLQGRITAINADIWSREDLNKLFTDSEALLNISFKPEVKDHLLDKSDGFVHMVQTVAKNICQKEGVFKTQPHIKEIGHNICIDEEILNYISQSNNRYKTLFEELCARDDSSEYEFYRWMLFVIIAKFEEKYLKSGLYFNAIYRFLEAQHPKATSFTGTTKRKFKNMLKKIVDMQSKINISPIVFDYDENADKLEIVDKTFVLWLKYQDKQDLLEHIDMQHIK